MPTGLLQDIKYFILGVQFADHILVLGFRRQTDNLAFQTTRTDKFKAYFHDIMQNLVFRKGVPVSKTNQEAKPRIKVLVSNTFFQKALLILQEVIKQVLLM